MDKDQLRPQVIINSTPLGRSGPHEVTRGDVVNIKAADYSHITLTAVILLHSQVAHHRGSFLATAVEKTIVPHTTTVAALELSIITQKIQESK